VLGRLDPPLRAALAADGGGSQLPFLFQAGFLLLKREMIDYEVQNPPRSIPNLGLFYYGSSGSKCQW